MIAAAEGPVMVLVARDAKGREAGTEFLDRAILPILTGSQDSVIVEFPAGAEADQDFADACFGGLATLMGHDVARARVSVVNAPAGCDVEKAISEAKIEPPPPPFKIGHLEIADILTVVRLVTLHAGGKPATLENIVKALTPVPDDLPMGVTPELALDCILWAVGIQKQHKQEMANHRISGAKIGYAKHLVNARFKITSKMLNRKRRKK